MSVQTRETLDKKGCGQANCTHDHSVLFLHGVCHMNAGAEVAYSKKSGTVTLRCNKCKQMVAEILVADKF